MPLGQAHMLSSPSEKKMDLKIMDPDLSDYPQASSQQYKIQLIPLPQMQNMYVQSATYDIHSLSWSYSLHHLTGESFYRHASQELCKRVEPG